MGQLNENKGTREDLSRYRITTAKEDLKAGQILLDADEYRGANNRAYYAIFHAINAIHALDGNGYKRHKDAIANFNKQYVKTEIFPREIGRKISKAEEIRHASDEFKQNRIATGIVKFLCITASKKLIQRNFVL